MKPPRSIQFRGLLKDFISLLLLLLPLPAGAVTGDSSEVVLRFAGDVLLGGHYEGDVGTDVNRAFQGFTLFQTADVSVVNLENPVTTRGAKVPKQFNFRMHPRYLSAIKSSGISAVSLANNHVFDYGREGIEDTFFWLDSAGIRYIGAGRSAEAARKPYIFRKGSSTVAVLAYYGGGEARPAGRNTSGVASRDLASIEHDTQVARDSGATYIVVILHWGTEKADTPDVSQRWFARALINAGVDAVIGHHPHVLQGIERYRKGVIVYSLGNFVFGGNSRSTYETGVFEIRVSVRKPVYRFIPVGVRNWRLNALAGRDSLRVVERVRRLSKVFPDTIP
jgi:poly-gamma-glutamate capsule biosynthesis protein CapA/YwtB (metallophosphatase superfamily)